jgi:hypothetical protein
VARNIANLVVNTDMSLLAVLEYAVHVLEVCERETHPPLYLLYVYIWMMYKYLCMCVRMLIAHPPMHPSIHSPTHPSTNRPRTYMHTHTQVKDIFVVGHYQCGGVKAAMEDKVRAYVCVLDHTYIYPPLNHNQ